MWNKKIIILFLVLISSKFYSQNYKFSHYTLEDGLSQETINTILKDSRGFLWLGTQDGLNRFDGDRFEVFKYEEQKNSISGNHITKLLEDDYKNIWIGTGNNGFCIYNPKNKSFKSIYIQNIDISDACTGLVKDSNGTIYISFFNQTLIRVNKYNNDKIDISEITYFHETSLTITCLKIINDTLFIGTKEGKIFYSNLKHKNLEFIELIQNNHWGRINTIENDSNGQLLIGSEFGVWKLDPEKNSAIKLTINGHDFFSKIVITDIVIKQKNLWIATDNGLYKLNNYHKDTTQFDTYALYKGDNNFSNTISSNNVHCLYLDNDFLWIGSNKLDLLEFIPPVFKTIESINKSCLKKPFVNNHVFSIYKEQNRIWVGTRAGLKLVHNDQTHVFRKTKKPNSLAYNVIRGIQKDSKNNLWIATTKGISILNLDDFSFNQPNFISTYHNAKDPQSLSENNTRSIFIDHKQNVWITTFGGGLNLFTGNLRKGKFNFLHFKNKPKFDNSLSSNMVLTMIQDHRQHYWIATKNGLNQLFFEDNDFKKPIFKRYRHAPQDSTSLSNNSVLSVFEDSDNILWVGTQNGLNRFDRSTATFKTYNKKDGLLNPVVYNILEDNNKNLWISSNLGLFCFNKTTETFQNYTTKDGLQSTEFNLGAAFNDSISGTLYFGGINDLNFFNPSTVSKLDKEGKLVFTELRIKNDVQSPSKQEVSVLEKNIIQTKKIQLKHSQFPFYLSFSNIDLRRFKNNTYMYKLEPMDDSWNDLSSHQEVQFLNLSPGQYKLKVQGKTRNKTWNKAPLELHIEILPPWWKTNLMLIIYSLLIILTLLGTHRFLLQRKLSIQEARKLKELDEQKNKLYTNITHEFRTPITVILGICNILKESFNNQKYNASTSHFKMIERNGKSMLRLVNQMLDLTKIQEGKLKLCLQYGNVVDFFRYIVSSYTSYAKLQGRLLTFYTECDTILMDFDQHKIQQILSNLITNAIKFSAPNSGIIVHLNKKDSNLIIKVKDSGKGICKEELPLIFNRFYRIDPSQKKQQEGTGIGLTLTKELVILMGGTITATSILNKGSVFSIHLPITNISKNVKEPLQQEESKEVILPCDSLPPNNHTTYEDKPLILIIEDNIDVVTLLSLSLESKYNIVSALNGIKGEEKAIQLIPDIIICDVMMPGKDGYEVCEALPHAYFWRAVDINAPVETTFRWLCQLKVAPYSYDWIDNLGRTSPRALTPGLERLEVNQKVMFIFRLVEFQVNDHLTMVVRSRSAGKLFSGVAVTYRVVPVDGNKSRLVVKLTTRLRWGALGKVYTFLFGWGDLIMMRKQLLTLKNLASRAQAGALQPAPA